MARPSRPHGPRRGRQCEACGDTYNATYSAQRTCGRTCGVQINTQTTWPNCRVYIGSCVQCGDLFTAQKKRGCCSEACALRIKRGYDRVYNEARPRKNPAPAPCLTCSQGMFPFPPRNCPACVTQRKRGEKRRRAALKRGVATESYTLAEIAERDRYRCGLCRKRVAMAKAVPDSDAPTVDHVVPLSCGGDDTRANVQLAHFLCNSRKSANGSQQLALIG